MLKKGRQILEEYRKEIIAFGVIVLVIMVGLITPTFAVSTPVSSVIFTSQTPSYEDGEPGSWQVEKSGKWIEKGIAEVSFDVSTTLLKNTEYTDIIFVLDISGSMWGDKLERVKQDTTELLESLLSNGENRAALITFDTESRIVSELTNDKDLLTQEVNNIQATGTTNYYQSLVNVDTILKDYEKEENREMIVLFLTDGYPNEDTPNQIAQYRYLKSEYPYITINGIQYEMGGSILDPVKEVSDNQFIADMETLNNVLFDASVVSAPYDSFQIVDYIENDYFILESEDDITVSVGEVTLEEENGLQKITWTISNFRSGSNANLSMNLKLKDELIGQGGVYPTNRREQIISMIQSQNENENVNSTLTPALQENYQVIYDGNAPDGCSVENIPEKENHSVFDVVSISEEQLSCSGYEFKGWGIVTDNITKVNDDYFIMPESDVILRAKWGKVSISKSMNGEVYTAPTLYSIMQNEAVMDNISSTYVSSSNGIDFSEDSSDTNGKGVYTRAGTEDDEYPVHYYRGDVDNNHVKFAGFCWRTVRTTSTGGVKLIYDGVPRSDGSCNNIGEASQIGISDFNSNIDSPADIGYMYGTRYIYGGRSGSSTNGYIYGNDVTWDGSQYTLIDTYTSRGWETDKTTLATKYHYTCLSASSTCTSVYYIHYFGLPNYIYYLALNNGVNIEDAKNEMFTNTNNSTAKNVIDTWYEENMTDYTRYLEDTVWCNDRSVISGALKGKDANGTELNYFGAYGRNVDNISPSLECSNRNDSFTVNSENGNGALTYPIAMLTADELTLAGNGWNGYSSDSYLTIGEHYWSFSPYTYDYCRAIGFRVFAGGYLSNNRVDVVNGFRPSVSLAPGMMVSAGDGSSISPYEIFTY